MLPRPPPSTLFPYTTLFRSALSAGEVVTERLQTRPNGRHIDVPDGMIHHWVGTVLLPSQTVDAAQAFVRDYARSEEHTSELQSLRHLVCRLLLEKKNNK